MSDEDQPIVTAKITITRRFYPQREDETADTIFVEVDGEPTLIEQLGMLEFGRLVVSSGAINEPEPDDDDDD